MDEKELLNLNARLALLKADEKKPEPVGIDDLKARFQRLKPKPAEVSVSDLEKRFTEMGGPPEAKPAKVLSPEEALLQEMLQAEEKKRAHDPLDDVLGALTGGDSSWETGNSEVNNLINEVRDYARLHPEDSPSPSEKDSSASGEDSLGSSSSESESESDD